MTHKNFTPEQVEFINAQTVRVSQAIMDRVSTMLACVSDNVQRELAADANEITKATKIQVVNSLFEDGLISPAVRGEILLGIGFEEMDPV